MRVPNAHCAQEKYGKEKRLYEQTYRGARKIGELRSLNAPLKPLAAWLGYNEKQLLEDCYSQPHHAGICPARCGAYDLALYGA